MKVIKHGKEAIECPECGSKNYHKIIHLENWFDSFINILSFDESHKAIKCLNCQCVFKPEDEKI